MILLIFASGFIVTIASLFRAICQIGNSYSLVGLSMDVEVRSYIIHSNCTFTLRSGWILNHHV